MLQNHFVDQAFLGWCGSRYLGRDGGRGAGEKQWREKARKSENVASSLRRSAETSTKHSWVRVVLGIYQGRRRRKEIGTPFWRANSENNECRAAEIATRLSPISQLT